MTAPPPPARVWVMLSGDPRRNIVLRRGPTAQVAAFNWDRTSNRITLGQWLKGRVFFTRCDISPDGEHWAYFAMGRSASTYTVVAKTPFMTALDFFEGCGTWDRGAAFLGNGEYAVYCSLDGPKNYRTSGLRVAAQGPAPLHRRLLSQGWEPQSADMFQKPAQGPWRLVKRVGQPRGRADRAVDTESHALIHTDTGDCIERPSWEWADA